MALKCWKIQFCYYDNIVILNKIKIISILFKDLMLVWLYFSAQRGNAHWMRKDGILHIQWKDNKRVNLLSTAHMVLKAMCGSTEGEKCMETEDSEETCGHWWVKEKDKEDSEETCGHLWVKSKYGWCAQKGPNDWTVQRWWITLFFHLVDVAIVNSFTVWNLSRNTGV